MNLKFGQQLRFLMRKHDITVAVLSRKTGISSKTIYQWLNGQQPRKVDRILLIANVLNVRIENLLFGEVPTDYDLTEQSKEEVVTFKIQNYAGQDIVSFQAKMFIHSIRKF